MSEEVRTTVGAVAIPDAPKAEEPQAKSNPVPKPLSRYMKNKLAAQALKEHATNKKAAKKAAKSGTKVAGKLNIKARKVATSKAAVKKILKKEVDKSSSSKSGACSICGKPLSRHTSVSQGMGDTCAAKLKMLPKGVTMEQHYEAITVTELPKGYLKFREVAKAVKKAGISIYRFGQATGGDRMLRPALNEHFKVIVFKGTRYVPASSLKHFSDLAKV